MSNGYDRKKNHRKNEADRRESNRRVEHAMHDKLAHDIYLALLHHALTDRWGEPIPFDELAQEAHVAARAWMTKQRHFGKQYTEVKGRKDES